MDLAESMVHSEIAPGSDYTDATIETSMSTSYDVITDMSMEETTDIQIETSIGGF